MLCFFPSRAENVRQKYLYCKGSTWQQNLTLVADQCQCIPFLTIIGLSRYMKFDIIVVINPYLPWKWNSKVDVISSLQTKASDQWFSRWCCCWWRQEEAPCQYQIYIKFNQIRTPDFRFKQKGTETNLLILTFNLTAWSWCPDNGDDGVRVQTEICVSWD